MTTCIVLDQSQRSILSQEGCYHNFNRKLQGVKQLSVKPQAAAWSVLEIIMQHLRNVLKVNEIPVFAVFCTLSS